MKATTMFIFLLLTLLTLTFTAACNLPALNRTPVPSSPTTETLSLIATNTYLVGDLGWGTIHGKVTDSVTGNPISGAKITCQQSSYSSPSLCKTSTLTLKDGTFTFPENFFHDTDHVQLEAQAKGYVTQTIEVNFFTSPWLNADFALVRAIGTEPPQVMCTQPACGPYESLFCPQGDCPNGCGYTCATPAAICTPPLCAIGTNEVYFCSVVCPGGCGTTCATITPGP